MTSGTVVMAFNVPELEGKLYLSPETISGIFLGAIVKWNDSALVTENPGVTLPTKAI